MLRDTVHQQAAACERARTLVPELVQALRDGGPMQMAEGGMPVLLVAVLPRAQIDFTDDWFVQGLKGTGSFDYNVQDVFVPEARVFPLLSRDARRGGAV